MSTKSEKEMDELGSTSSSLMRASHRSSFPGPSYVMDRTASHSMSGRRFRRGSKSGFRSGVDVGGAFDGDDGNGDDTK